MFTAIVFFVIGLSFGIILMSILCAARCSDCALDRLPEIEEDGEGIWKRS